ncbi:CLUMA_CG002523, isoform B [Clunio marinus]|uniref:CLUMA_CG002523, isoform B n=1 Tax=Clunio marinus TaxID=568069 RepID=A0A1J1HNS1_9DIPT|nr:CLUMA_CG002523, isoform B [Clunio marinus]
MKILLTILCAFVIGASASALLGRKKCTYGPSYWCSSIPNAKSCGAVKHCIKAVWEKQHVPEDTDSICKICVDMVGQARDQLESNETQEEIKEVFEGSCDLIPIKPVKIECKKLADGFIPELIEALASQMNPQVVCSTAGLCNSEKIDKMLEEFEAEKKSNLLSCDQCDNIGNVISHKFHTSTRDQILDGFLGFCGRLSSFSDACSSLILTYFNDIYDELSKSLNADAICHMSGVCSAKFHQHDDDSSAVKIETLSNVGFIKNKEAGEDVPCELCEQLIKHLRDMLVANTTELEFKTVLEGLCKQTKKSFQQECVSLVDQYYPIIYETLVNNLDANGACFMIGVCPKGNNQPFVAPSNPMLPVNQELPKRQKLGVNEKAIDLMPLPIDQLMGIKTIDQLQLVDGGEWCTVCQYFMHFIQEELSDAKNEDEIKNLVGKSCKKFPTKLAGECLSFIELYGDAIVALIVQEIDPREICPQLKMCPENIKDAEIIKIDEMDVQINEESKPTCPLCVLVVQETENYIKTEKTKESVKKALDKVCSRLPPKPQLQCTDFVQTYYDELLEKLLSDFSPKDVCTEMKLCPALIGDIDESSIKVGIDKIDNIPYVGGDIDTNEIPDYTINGQPINAQEIEESGECMLCVEVVGGAENKIRKGMKKEQIESILLRECSKFRAYEDVCDGFVKKNVDKIIELLANEMSPKQVCQQLSLCAKKPQDLEIDEAIIVNVFAVPSYPHSKLVRVPLQKNEVKKSVPPVADDPQCVVCEFVMTKLEAELKDKKTRDEIRTAVENICTKMPKSISKQCTKFVEEYADLIITLVDTVPPKEICQQMGLCPIQKKEQRLLGESECTWGPSHFCSNEKIAEACKATKYCQDRKLGMFA